MRQQTLDALHETARIRSCLLGDFLAWACNVHVSDLADVTMPLQVCQAA